MQNYQKILIALDVFAEYDAVLERGLKMADNIADVFLIHVTLPHVYFEPYGAAFETEVAADIQAQSRDKLNKIAQEHGIAEDNARSAIGYAADEIKSYAEEINADLIVIGTHGRSGLKLLLGSTANGVLHGVKRDVLAVKV
jgi:universal stress protein A